MSEQSIKQACQVVLEQPPAVYDDVHNSVKERRATADRRSLSWKTYYYSIVRPRRRQDRRGDSAGSFVDFHKTHLLIVSVAILLVSSIDAAVTLNLISLGAHVNNPVVAYFLDIDARVFSIARPAVVGIALIILVPLANFRVYGVMRVWQLLYLLLLTYLALVAYDGYLLIHFG